MHAYAIIGRDEELAAISAFVDRIEEGPSALVLSGEPGIGKTILWEAGVETAQERFDRVLTCRGVEALLSFAGLSDLFGNVLDELESLLAPPRRRALEVALLLSDPGDSSLDPHAVGLAVLDVLRALAERASVLVALDDIQWLDPSSAGVLQIAFRRLRTEQIGVLATRRTAPGITGLLAVRTAISESSSSSRGGARQASRRDARSVARSESATSRARRPGRVRFDDHVRAVFVGEPVEHPRLEESALRLARIL
jgi:hypothetical protein